MCEHKNIFNILDMMDDGLQLLNDKMTQKLESSFFNKQGIFHWDKTEQLSIYDTAMRKFKSVAFGGNVQIYSVS